MSRIDFSPFIAQDRYLATTLTSDPERSSDLTPRWRGDKVPRQSARSSGSDCSIVYNISRVLNGCNLRAIWAGPFPIRGLSRITARCCENTVPAAAALCQDKSVRCRGALSCGPALSLRRRARPQRLLLLQTYTRYPPLTTVVINDSQIHVIYELIQRVNHS